MPSRGDPTATVTPTEGLTADTEHIRLPNAPTAISETIQEEEEDRMSGWSGVDAGVRRSRAPSQCSSVHFQRGPPGVQSTPRPGSVSKVLITQGSDDDDDLADNEEDDEEVDDDEDDFFGAATPPARRESRLSQGLPDSDEDDIACSGSDLDHDIGVDIDNPEGYDTDLDIDGEEWLREPESFDPSGIKDYIKECNRVGVIPVTYFRKHIQDKHFVMRHHGLGPLGAKAIAKPLENNTFIEKIDLEGNCIQGDGAFYLSRVLRENLYVSHLVLSENELRSSGVKAICDMLQDNTTIVDLDLSGNQLKDSDGEHFYNLLVNNSTLRTLSLKNNNFEVEGARWFKDALTQNENLKMLDLSWNHLRRKGAEYIAEMVMENYGLKYLNLTMNGLGNEGAKAMGHALAHNQCLLEINLSSNRITKEGAYLMSRGLMVNDVLETLRLGMNPIALEGSMVVLAAIDKNTNSCIHFLDLTNIIVSDAFENLHEKIKEEDHRVLKVIHGGVLYRPKRVAMLEEDPEAAFQRDPMTKLKHYAEVNKLRLVDLFKQFDKDQSWTVDRDEFVAGVKSTGIEMTEEEIDVLINRLDKDGDGEIDYGELVEGDNQHREEKRRLAEIVEIKEKKAREAPEEHLMGPSYQLLGEAEEILIQSLTPIDIT